MKEISTKEYKKIIARRDPKYDGRFYFGVKTTGIYCRPICPARPKPENILIFKSPSQAEANGYRPCKRCHPDLSPGRKFTDKKYSIVSKALEFIETDENEGNIETLSKKLKVSSRHLRRLFEEYLGASPIQVVKTKRLHLAKQLLLDSDISITEIALGVGFNSIRRFNEAFKELYEVSPSFIRKNRKNERKSGGIQLYIQVRKPYDWDYILQYLKRHIIHGSEVVTDDKYIRYITGTNKKVGKIEVTFDAKKSHLCLLCSQLSLRDVKKIIPRIKRLLDVEHNPFFINYKSEKKRSVKRVNS